MVLRHTGVSVRSRTPMEFSADKKAPMSVPLTRAVSSGSLYYSYGR
jgi:hypothetical protein